MKQKKMKAINCNAGLSYNIIVRGIPAYIGFCVGNVVVLIRAVIQKYDMIVK